MYIGDLVGLGQLIQGEPTTRIDRIVHDSRQAGPGALFVALPGTKFDGHLFVREALARGASAVCVEQPVQLPPEVPVLLVESTRGALGQIAAHLYGHPSRSIRVIGVTGTNGKTTTTHLIRAILMAAGQKVGLIGTVHNLVGERELAATLTTPQASDVQALLRAMVDDGCTYAVMEVSSEGLAMGRVADVEFDVAVFTNLTQDHLNYHKTFEAYRDAKGMLFDQVERPGAKSRKVIILNQDDPAAAHYAAGRTAPVWTYSVGGSTPVMADGVRLRSNGTQFQLHLPDGIYPISLLLAGQFNVANAMAAAAVGLAEGVSPALIVQALSETPGVPGRMEAVAAGQPFGLFVDYAHSPDGLENVLKACQSFTQGRVLCVFGCGGDRDRTKRAKMGRIAAELADYSILTSDNPRTEDPLAILAEIEAGFRQVESARPFYEVEPDRARAIARAVELAGDLDVVLIAGKGHETYQIFPDRTIDFDDRLVARAAIESRLGLERRPRDAG
ncbi:MAG TPA: UDP-N-acetylmuramoyl-L-alanyl-D-glutamate--2,6-diaminopimelate ligase [Symbiobacteriaceae bacterium]|nr:UDP-N-acetylmuramoyl-L-alanyl-D-glutamate--2,6-diaminopimelate ligase [Symbiobacteriaceae bacterium]